MKKVALKNLNLTNFSNFVGTLIPLNEASTIYFNIDSDRIYTDSHNDSGTIIKSISRNISTIAEKNNIEEKIKLCFYDGKKVLKALSFLNGNTVDCVIGYQEVDGENYAETLKIVGSKMNITLDAADPELIEFANVPEDAIQDVKSVDSADCSFTITGSELLQIQKLCDFDNSSELTFSVNGSVKVGTENSFEIKIDENFEGLNGQEKVYKIDKDLFKLIDQGTYKVYPIGQDYRIIFKSEESATDIVVTLHEEV
jgi:hypothetical protein